MTVEAHQPQRTSAQPETSGQPFYDETQSCIPPDDHTTFQTMLDVTGRYVISLQDGKALLPATGESAEDIMHVLERTDYQRGRAMWLHQEVVGHHDAEDVFDYQLDGIPQAGVFERLVIPELLPDCWRYTMPAPIDDMQRRILRHAIAVRAGVTTDEAEIAGLRYVCAQLGFEQTFLEPKAQPDIRHIPLPPTVLDTTMVDGVTGGINILQGRFLEAAADAREHPVRFLAARILSVTAALNFGSSFTNHD